MSTNAQTTAEYLNFSLLQLGAESYLQGINTTVATQVVERWKYGFNDPTHPFIDPDYVDPKTGIRGRAAQDSANPDAPFGADKAVLPGYNRMVAEQASALVRKYEIVDHHANDAAGFSATLYRRTALDLSPGEVAGSYVLSMRGTNGSRAAISPRSSSRIGPGIRNSVRLAGRRPLRPGRFRLRA